MRSCIHVSQKALPRTGQRQKLAEKKIVPRRPKRELRGSDNQQPKKAVPMYGAALTRPTISLS